jgi:UDPglucose 6-dehydrogenase
MAWWAAILRAVRACVAGLWHLGAVTAACLASVGHDVVGFDEDSSIVDDLRRGRGRVREPGLDQLLTQPTLSFTANRAEAVVDADVLWIAYDTPVDDDDHADVGWVLERARLLIAACPPEAFVLVSSQVPVGSTRRIAYVPENLRLGSAIDAFMNPARIVVGVDATADRELVEPLLAPITKRIEWTSIESAEMTKHALNAFLAASIAFANEVAVLSEQVGADARDVARALKSDPRVGARAYLDPGAAFAGGTLARDVEFLTKLSEQTGVATPVLAAVRPSNQGHMQWPLRTVERVLEGPGDETVAVWGLTYKPGTDTLRRSSALQLCTVLTRRGVNVRAHDPAVLELPRDVSDNVSLFSTPLEALEGTSALVVATPWPEFRAVVADDVVERMRAANVIDPTGALADTLGRDTRVRYFTVGKGLT